MIDLSTLPDRELDALVAEKFFEFDLQRFCTDWSATGALIEEMRRRKWSATLHIATVSQAKFWNHPTAHDGFGTDAEIGRAVVIAALRAVEKEEKQ